MKHLVVALIISLSFLSCGTATNRDFEAQTTYSNNNADIEALASLYNSLGTLIQSDFATCASTGNTADLLINKICQIAQAATVEQQIQLLAQLGEFQAVLGDRIDNIKIDIINEATTVDGEITSINSTISNLASQINDPTSGLLALQAAITSLTRNNYELVKSLTDLPGCDPSNGTCPSVITLSANTDYEINGLINVGTSRIELSNGTQIYGLNNLNDGITYTGTSALFTNTGYGSSIIRNLQISAPSATKVFNISGNASTRVYVNNNYFSNCSSLGSITTASSVWFYSNESNTTTSMSGLVIDGTVSYLNFSNNVFNNTSNTNLTTMLQITSGIFSTVRISNNVSLSATGNTNLRAFNIIVPSPTQPSVADGEFSNNDASNGLLFSSVGTQISSADAKWWFNNNVGLANSTIYGLMHLDTSSIINMSNTLNTPMPVRGNFIDDYHERTSIVTGMLENTVAGTTNSDVVLGNTPCGAGIAHAYAVGDLLTIAAGTQTFRVRVASIGSGGSAGKIQTLDYVTSYLPGNGYTTGTNLATTYYPGSSGTGTGCLFDINGASGKMTYTGTTTRTLKVELNGVVGNTAGTAKTVQIHLYKGNGTGAPVIIPGTTTTIRLSGTASDSLSFYLTKMITMSANDYIEVWAQTSANNWKFTQLTLSISEL